MNELQDKILELTKEIYKEKGYTPEVALACQKALNSKDGKWNFYFAKFLSVEYRQPHLQVVIDSKDVELNFFQQKK